MSAEGVKDCRFCGKGFMARRDWQAYCSRACRDARSAERNRKLRSLTPEQLERALQQRGEIQKISELSLRE